MLIDKFKILFFFLLYIVSQVRLSLSLESDDFESAFVQTGDELHYFVDPNQWSEAIFAHVFVERIETFDKKRKESTTTTKKNTKSSTLLTQLRFEPSILEFDSRPLSVPELKKVKVYNSGRASVRFEAISGSTVHFHCSFFGRKTLEAGSSTTFDVIFLPREEGPIDNTLFIHSSAGVFKYKVSGVGIPNPYRLRPFVGAKVPLNGSLVESLEIYNPYATTLKVTEIYSSGGDLHLELPDGSNRASDSIWEIPPFRTQTVIKARFIGTQERNTTAFIRIKTNMSSGGRNKDRNDENLLQEEAIYVPVEVEVVSKPGLFASTGKLDFGRVVNGQRSKWLTLNVYNTLNRTLRITGIEVDVEAVKVNFTPVTLKPNSRKASCIAKLAYYGSDEIASKTNGFVKIKSHDPQVTLNVPYNVKVIPGQLYHDNDEISFRCCDDKDERKIFRPISLFNDFKTPIIINDVKLPNQFKQYFKINSSDYPLLLPADQKTPICKLSLEIDHFTEDLRQLEPYIRVDSNISRFNVPLKIYDGKIRVTLYSMDQTSFDFGSLDINQERFATFALTNENPISVTMVNFGSAGLPDHTSLRFVGSEAGNFTVLSFERSKPLPETWKQGQNFTLFANTFAIFRLHVDAPSVKSSFFGHLNFTTQYENRIFPIRYTVSEGNLISIPEKLLMTNAFPGKISSHSLRVYSSYPRDMYVQHLSTLSSDPRFFFAPFEKDHGPLVRSKVSSQVGRIYFDPLVTCIYDCYVGMPLDTVDGHQWISGLKLPSNLPDIDFELFQKLKSRWNQIVANREDVINNTIMLDSTLVKNFAIPVETRLGWPRLIKNPAVHFPLTAVGNFTIVNLSLMNPSSLPIVVQILPLTIYPNPEDLIRLFKDELEEAPLTDFVEAEELMMFTLRDSELHNTRPENWAPLHRKALDQALGTQIPRFTLSVLLQPGMQVGVRLGFLPSDYDMRSSLLLIRNNLTILEMVTLYGRGAKVEMKIANKAPHSLQPLMFEIQEKHLAECENIKRLQHKLQTGLTLRRTFLAKNSGELPFTVTNMTINGVNCVNRGFRILNCFQFTLKPNESYELDIAFTPDFTLSWYDATLHIHLSGMHLPMVFYLGATIPREWLSKCQAALPRPYWESLLYYTTVIALAFSFICMIAMAYLEGDRIIICCLRRHFEEEISAMKRENVFNLGQNQQNHTVGEKCDKQKASAATDDKKSNIKSDPKAKKTDQSEPSHPPLYRRLVSLLVGLIKHRKLIRSSLFLSSNENAVDDDGGDQNHAPSVDDVVAPPPKMMKNLKLKTPPTTTTSAIGQKQVQRQKLTNKQQQQRTTARKTFSNNENDSELDDAAVFHRPIASTVIHFDYNNDESEAEAVAPSKSRLRRRQPATTVNSATLKDTTVNSRSAFKPIKSATISPTIVTSARKSKSPENLNLAPKVPSPVFKKGSSASPIRNEIPSDESDDRMPEWENAFVPETQSAENIDREFDMLSYQTALFTSGYMNESETITSNSRKSENTNQTSGSIANVGIGSLNGEKRKIAQLMELATGNSDLSSCTLTKPPAEKAAVARPCNFVQNLPIKIDNPISEAIAAGLLSPEKPTLKIPVAKKSPSNVKPSSKLIQELRAEREKRLREYRAKCLEEEYENQKSKLGKEAEEEWPGFNLDYRSTLGNLWDEDYEPAKWLIDKVEPQQQSVWSAPENNNQNSSNNVQEATRLFDLADTYSQRFGDASVEGPRGWTPNDPTPFGSFFEQQVRRRSSNLPYSGSPISTVFQAPAPPQDSSIVAWGPALPVAENSITKLMNTKHIWNDQETSPDSAKMKSEE